MNRAKICRMCSSKKERMKSIFYDYTYEQLQVVIVEVLQLEIRMDDGLPPNICRACVNSLTKLKEQIDQFRENDKRLRLRIERELAKEEGSANAGCSPVKPEKDELIVVKPEFPDPLESFDEADNSGDEVDRKDADSSGRESGDEDVPTDSNDIKQGQPGVVSFHATDTPGRSDHKCYICQSESMGSLEALLKHLSVHQNQIPYTCTECVKETVVLKNVRSLNAHKKMHVQPIQCGHCDRRFANYWTRDEHIRKFHVADSGPSSSTCEQCGRVCSSTYALQIHMREHKLDVVCDHCGGVFHGMGKLRQHVARVHGQADNFRCKFCQQVMDSLESYNAHKKMHHSEKPYSCDLCPKKFDSAGNLSLHKKAHAKNADLKPRKDWSTSYTAFRDPNGQKVFTCNICNNGNTFGTINRIINHVKTHFKDVPCDQCDLKFINRYQLKQHYVVHTRERNFRCEYCGKDFMYAPHMKHHIRQAHAHLDGVASVAFQSKIDN